MDAAIARHVAAGGCQACGGPLHRSDYDRKPRGGAIAAVGDDLMRRFSLCCGRDGCRKRNTPASLRFLSRRVYLGVVVIVACLRAQGVASAREVHKRTGVAARTAQRWIAWWRRAFIATAVFVAVRARLVGVEVGELPASLVGRLPGDPLKQVLRMMELLGPLTCGTVPGGSPIVRDVP